MNLYIWGQTHWEKAGGKIDALVRGMGEREVDPVERVENKHYNTIKIKLDHVHPLFILVYSTVHTTPETIMWTLLHRL